MARKVYDIKTDLTDTGEDLVIADGDFVISESTAAHQRNLLLCMPGEFKERPDVCVGSQLYVDDDSADLARIITQQFMQDGMEIKSRRFDPASITDSTVRPFIEAYYI